MSSQPFSPNPERLQELTAKITELREDLSLQKTILQSLQDVPETTDLVEEKRDLLATIERTKRKMNEARLAHHNAMKALGPKTNKPTVQPQSQRRPGHSSVPVWGSNFDQQGNNSMPRPTTPTTTKKRTYSHANVTPVRQAQSGSRARHNSPSPRVPNSTSSTASSSVIDLTGDDDEMMALQQQQRYEEFSNRNRLSQQDAAMARQLQEQGFSSGPGTSFQGTSSQFGLPASGVYGNNNINGSRNRDSATPLARMSQADTTPTLGLPHHYSVTLPPVRAMGQRLAVPNAMAPYGATNGTQSAPTYPGGRHDSMPRVPGAYVDLDDDSDLELISVNPVARYGSSTALSAAGIARSAALARQHFPGVKIPGYSSLVNDPYSAGRPGFINNGSSSYGLGSQGSQSSQNNIFVSGVSLLEPFAGPSLTNVISRTNGYNYDNMTDANGNPLDARVTNYVHDFMEDPRKTAEELRDLLSNIRPDMNIPIEERGETPEALKYPLYAHQQVALKWMSGMEESPNLRGGILADDMGLGKTISTLALMVTRQATDANKTNLIVGPVALIRQWELEIRKKLKPEHRLKVFLLHSKKLDYSELKNFDVVLTTFGILGSEWKRYEKRLAERKEDETYEPYDDVELHRNCPLIHPKSKFYRVILDEAQNIKNRNALASKGANQINATYRWCLTGTPMMNSVQELYPLIRFLKIKPYNNLQVFSKEFAPLTTNKLRAGYENSYEIAMDKLRVVLKTTMLRRMKDSTIDGKPILSLPPKTETIHNCVFSPDEHSFYKTLESKAQVTFNKYLRAGTVSKNYAHVLVLLLRLRQACCHPHLNMDVEYASAVPEQELALMEDFAKTLTPAVVDRLKESDAFDCPICFDAVEDPIIFVPCGHDTCSECFTALTENSRQANGRNEDGRDVPVKCPECRSEVSPKKVINYTAFRKVHMPETIVALPDAEENENDGQDDSDEDDTEDDDANEYGDLRDFIVRDDEEVDEDEDDTEDGAGEGGDDKDDDDLFPDVDGILGNPASAKPAKSKKGEKSKKSRKSKKRKAKEDEVKPHMLKTLRVEASKNQEARRKYMRYLRKNWESSAKVDKICEILKGIEPTGEKTIIFSQWTALLDLLEIPIKHELKIKSRRYDGGMSRAHRDEAIRQFVEDPSVKILLVSLRAGNAGLNLTVASHVILCDPFWNPFVEMQAVDRAHRIGQLLPVHVHRVVVKSRNENTGEGTEKDETVEDRILALQEKKREIINGALDEKAGRDVGRLTVHELRRLFGA